MEDLDEKIRRDYATTRALMDYAKESIKRLNPDSKHLSEYLVHFMQQYILLATDVGDRPRDEVTDDLEEVYRQRSSKALSTVLSR